MSIISLLRNRRSVLVASAVASVTLAAWGGKATSAQDKYSVSVPDGLAFSEFRGFESWPTVAVSQTGATIEVILGNPEMIKAYLAGDHDVGKHFPDGSKLVKIHWNAKQSDEAPAPTTIPGTLQNIDFMARDSKRFADSGGWGYAEFDYDTGSKSFAPMGTGYKCGLACHTIVKSKDYVFTTYGAR
jgi:hypothetical protein